MKRVNYFELYRRKRSMKTFAVFHNSTRKLFLYCKISFNCTDLKTIPEFYYKKGCWTFFSTYTFVIILHFRWIRIRRVKCDGSVSLILTLTSFDNTFNIHWIKTLWSLCFYLDVSSILSKGSVLLHRAWSELWD